MKHWVTIILASLAIILTALYLVNSVALIIGLAVILLVGSIIIVFTGGIWYAHKSIQLGSKLTLDAQSQNDQWDTVKMQSLAKFGQEMLKVKPSTGIDYPPLLENETIEAKFIVDGLDN